MIVNRLLIVRSMTAADVDIFVIGYCMVAAFFTAAVQSLCVFMFAFVSNILLLLCTALFFILFLLQQFYVC